LAPTPKCTFTSDFFSLAAAPSVTEPDAARETLVSLMRPPSLASNEKRLPRRQVPTPSILNPAILMSRLELPGAGPTLLRAANLPKSTQPTSTPHVLVKRWPAESLKPVSLSSFEMLCVGAPATPTALSSILSVDWPIEAPAYQRSIG